MCENTFRHQTGLNFSLDRTCFFHETFPPSSPVPAICSKAGDHSALGASFPCSTENVSCPSAIHLIGRWAGGAGGSQSCRCQLPRQLRRCHFPLAPSVVCTLSRCFLGALSGPVTAECLSPACLQSRVCCYGENFTLAGMSSFLICFVVGRGPRNQSVAELIYLPFPP